MVYSLSFMVLKFDALDQRKTIKNKQQTKHSWSF